MTLLFGELARFLVSVRPAIATSQNYRSLKDFTKKYLWHIFMETQYGPGWNNTNTETGIG